LDDVAVDADGAAVDGPLDAVALGGGEDVLDAADVDLVVVGVGVAGGAEDAGEVVDPVHAFDGAADVGGAFDDAGDDLGAEGGECGRIAGGAGEDAVVVAAGEESAGEVAADDPGCAGDECSHGWLRSHGAAGETPARG